MFVCPECLGDRFISRRSFVGCPACEGDGCIYDDEPMEPCEQQEFLQRLVDIRACLNEHGSLGL